MMERTNERMCCAVRCCNVTETESQNPKRSRSATIQRAAARARARALERKPKSLKIYNTQTAYESLEGPQHTHTQIGRRSDRQRDGQTDGGGMEELRLSWYKEISEAKIVRKWFGTWFSHDRHTCPFLMCVCVSVHVCVCVSLL